MSQKLQDLSDTAQIKQVLLWLNDDVDLRAWFLAEPEAVIQAWADSGHILSEKAQRQLLKSIQARGFEATFERYNPDHVIRSADEALTIASPVTMHESAISKGDNSVADDETAVEDAPERVVSTGFANETLPAEPADAHKPLAPDSDYYFWFEVGAPVEGAIDAEPVELPVDKLPPDAKLQVALFTFDGGLEIMPGSDVGEIEIAGNGRIRVTKPAAQPSSLIGKDLLERRLFFPIHTPVEEGAKLLRCSVYYQQTLVQSHLVTAHVAANPTRQNDPVLSTKSDYTLSRSLNGRQLQGMGENRLSLMLNDNGNGTHDFRFFGEGEFKNEVKLGEMELTDLIKKARGIMRKAAWGDEEEYKKEKMYRYEGRPNPKRLADDLINFAKRGKRFYVALSTKLADDDLWGFTDLMLPPGQVQIAFKHSSSMIIPAALFYDYPLDDGRPDHTLCPDFLTAFKAGTDLADTECFQGRCPSYKDKTIVCPSGFWGYRHSLGFPLSIGNASDAPPEIPSSGTPRIDVSMYPDFDLLPQHLERLQHMGFSGDGADTRDETLDMLKESHAQMIYFYCHGGVTNENIPYLQVDANRERRFTQNSLFDERIRWQKPRPLVFINGCHTTALSPDAAINLVSGFVEISHAAGVVGTEITIFEPIAVSFAEECFDRFLLKRQTLGEAIRGARLKMLQAGNPLGLVYIPFAMAGLKISES